jgi:hypothetical protein
MPVEGADGYSVGQQVISTAKGESNPSGSTRQKQKKMVPTIPTAVEGEIELRAAQAPNYGRNLEKLL